MRPSTFAATVAAAVATVAAVLAQMGSPRLAGAEPPASLHLTPRHVVTVVGGGEQPTEQVRAELPEADRVRVRPSRRARDDGHAQEAEPADDGRLDIGQRTALREAGWSVPAKLAETWVLRDGRVLDDHTDHGGALQLVYTRGGDTVSVFQRREPRQRPRMPSGGVPVPELAGTVMEWPHAQPPRLAWQVEERTFVVVGDTDRQELLQIARSLPVAEPEDLWQRVQRGLRELLVRLRL